MESVLAQTEQPLEILICDDCSSDDTPDRFQAWAEHRCQVRFLRLPRHSGAPAATRNLGIEHARGGWIAFLDDDDEWLPNKLARQRAAFAVSSVDVIASNAVRGDGSLYFPSAPPSFRPARADLLRANPIITSSALVRRRLATFPTAWWTRGVEDYAAWLDVADRGARFLVIGEPLLRYDDTSAARMSAARARRELNAARLAIGRALYAPSDTANLRAAARKTATALYVAGHEGIMTVARRRRSH